MYTDDITTIETDDITADKFVEYMLKEYGKFMLDSKVPNIIDGLKTVHRRVLYTLGITEEYDKMATVAGTVMQIHPHGDASIASAILNLTLPYANIIPLIACDSNVGTYANPDDASQPRYLDIMSHPFVRDVFFKHTSTDALYMKVTVTGKGFEPSHFIPTIPYALLVCTVGMGPGFKTEIYPLSFENMYKLTRAYLKCKNSDNGHLNIPKCLKYLIPDLPTPGIIRNRRQLMADYKLGNYDAPILVEGRLKLTKNSITITNIPYGIRFPDNTEDKFRKEIQQRTKLGGMITNITNPIGMGTSIYEGAIELTLMRGVDPFKVLDEIKKKCKFCHHKTPYRLYVSSDGTGHKVTPFSLLDKWYDSRHNAILVELKYKQKKLIQEQRKYEALIIAKANADDVFKIFRSSNDWEIACDILHKKYDLTAYQAKFLKDIKFERITNKGREDLQITLDNIKSELRSYHHHFTHIGDRMEQELEYVYHTHKHRTQRMARFPNYIGYVKFKTGVIQVFDKAELDEVLTNFNKVPCEINLYGNNKYKYIIKNNEIIDETRCHHPKEFSCTNYYALPYPLKYVICLTEEGKLGKSKGLRLRSDIPVSNQLPVGDEYISIHKNGLITLDKSRDIIRLLKTDIIHIHNEVHNKLVMAYRTKSVKNSIRFEKVNYGDTLKFFSGTNNIIGIYDGEVNDILINLPDKTLSKYNDIIYIPDINKFFGNKQIVTLKLTTMTNNIGVKLKRF